jgi:hypothetical protein
MTSSQAAAELTFTSVNKIAGPVVPTCSYGGCRYLATFSFKTTPDAADYPQCDYHALLLFGRLLIKSKILTMLATGYSPRAYICGIIDHTWKEFGAETTAQDAPFSRMATCLVCGGIRTPAGQVFTP